jgi:integrase/recombinase XerC
MFFGFLEAQHLYDDITRNVRSPQTKVNEFKRDFLEREDALKIFESIDRRGEVGKRDYALILACVSCGFRIIELQRANIGDIETHAGERRLYIQGKGHLEKDAYKKIEPELWEALEDYITSRGNPGKDAPLFAAVASNAKAGGGRLTEPSISRIIKGVLKRAGYDSRRITAHSLRHTSVTLDRKAGASLEEASKHARHSSIVITQRYDHALERAEAKDERRIMDYLFKGEAAQEDPEGRAAELMARIPAAKREKALELLEALAN